MGVGGGGGIMGSKAANAGLEGDKREKRGNEIHQDISMEGKSCGINREQKGYNDTNKVGKIQKRRNREKHEREIRGECIGKRAIEEAIERNKGV